MSNSSFLVGDMVTLKDYCKNSGRLAIITEARLGFRLNSCKIQYIDAFSEAPERALYSNLNKVI